MVASVPVPGYPPASPQEPLLAVPPRRAMGWKIVASGVGLFGLLAYQLMRPQLGTPRLVFAVILGLLALLMVLSGLPIALRRRPVLSADASGIRASYTGMDMAVVPWERITGIELVGTKDQRALVVLVDDAEAFFASQKKHAMHGICRGLNMKHGVSGAAYVLTRSMRADPGQVAQQLRELAVRAIEAAEA